jgi:hypothetical protein
MKVTNTSTGQPTGFNIAGKRYDLKPGESVNISNNHHEAIRTQCNAIPHLVADWFEGADTGTTQSPTSPPTGSVTSVNSKKIDDTLEYLTKTKANVKSVYNKEEIDRMLATKVDSKQSSVASAVAIFDNDGNVYGSELKLDDLERSGASEVAIAQHIKSHHPEAKIAAKQPETRGPTGKRPRGGVKIGVMFFDTDIKIPIWWNGKIWVDASGEKA